LDDPLPVQYVKWLGQVVQGDFGVSLVTQTPVADEFVRRAPVTIELAVMALAIALIVGLPLALVSGLAGSRRAARHGSRMTGALAMSVPDFVLGAILVYLFSQHQWFFTIGKYVPFEEDPVANFQAMFLPALTLSVFGIAVIARTGRDAVQAVTQGLHVTAAVAAGESRWQIIRRHVLRNASIPVLTVTTTFAGYILGGAVIIEMLYSLPGVGLYVYTGINGRDYTVVQAGVLLAAAIFVVINILTDILYGVLDPRIGARQTRS
jgi:peptide/nickel transport system permease protein